MERLSPPNLPPWLAAMLPPNINRYAIKAGGHEFSVMELGDPDGLPVVMAHGNPTWGFLYRHIAQRLRDDGLRLIMPDMVGLGFSSRVGGGEHTLQNHGGWFAALLDALDLPPSVFVIQDWGGPIACHALTRCPERLAGLVVLNTVLGPPKPDFRPTTFHRVAHMPLVGDALFRGLGMPQAAMQFAQGDRTSIRGRVARAYRFPIERFSPTPLALARMVPDSLSHPSVGPLTEV
ncbi:MAG: pimeloyl-ACP methyl ester carboxylesterase, partial [Myxococcota bacterium]